MIRGAISLHPGDPARGVFPVAIDCDRGGQVSLASGEAGANPQKVKAIVIRPDTLARWLSSETFAIQLEMIEEAPRPASE